MFNISLPSNKQWLKVLTAFGYAFISAFLAVLTAAGGFKTESEANVALILAALTAGINAGLYALYITFFKKS